MKVLGITSEGYSDAYIVQVSHAELARVFEKGYRDELPKLKVGQEVNLAEAPDFRNAIKRACEDMEAAYKSFSVNSPALLKFAAMVRDLPDQAAGADGEPAQEQTR
jgi:hypothetical protein